MSEELIGEIVQRVVHKELAPVREKLEKLEVLLVGPEGEPGKGMIVRFDRLEQSEKSRKFWIGTAVTLALGSCLESVRSFFTRLGGGGGGGGGH